MAYEDPPCGAKTPAHCRHLACGRAMACLELQMAKLEIAQRAERENFAKERQAEYRAAHRRLNRSERRKLSREIGKVERGDFS